MKVLIVRHGVAEETEAWAKKRGKSRQRPLTDSGIRKMHRSARGLARLIWRVDLVVSSPLTRAVQTGEIIAEAFDAGTPAVTSALSPGREPMELLNYLRAHRDRAKRDEKEGLKKGGAVIAIVGHEPDLGLFVSWVLTGLKESFIGLKKGGACLIELDNEVRAGRGKLLWMARPDQLRRLSKRR